MNTNYADPVVPSGLNVFTEWMSETFRLWSAKSGIWILQGLLFLAIIFCLQLLCDFIFRLVGFTGFASGTTDDSTTRTAVQEFLVSLIPRFIFNYVIGSLAINTAIGYLAASFLTCGMLATAFKQLRGEPIAVIDLFSALRFGWGALVYIFAISLGLFACCLGVFATFGLFFLAVPLMIARKMPTLEALQLSWRTVSKNFWLYTLFALAMSLLSSAGIIACGIGIFFTLPFFYIGMAVAYFHTFEQQTSRSALLVNKASTPPALPL